MKKLEKIVNLIEGCNKRKYFSPEEVTELTNMLTQINPEDTQTLPKEVCNTIKELLSTHLFYSTLSDGDPTELSAEKKQHLDLILERIRQTI
ncbi:hypothetical protein [Desulfovibrio litoralis]|uniref:Uncharacterized protein n=1 Tax=Desulfovibrio litoralis DSM 11393 TaxID=1121455 RepID=A0A1M7T8K4_9BACT|nr:hypothetical protein [Desulfovibrio litoralis]SHN67041.1 hypothetical protein SAMN02745728_01726 [Desulfovibrio litoralis DSM 11393]